MSETIVDKYLSEKNKNVRVLTIVAVVITSILAIIAGGEFILAHWVPTLEIVSVDFQNGVCVLKIGSKQKTLIGDDTLFVKGAWGVRFGTTTGDDDDQHYETVELVKDGMVYHTLATRTEKVVE